MLVSVIMTALGFLYSINVLSNRTISWVWGKLMHGVPSSFHKNATASSLNSFTPLSKYWRIIVTKVFNTFGLRKSKSTWSWLKVHHTCCWPTAVWVSRKRGLSRGLTTSLKSSSGSAVTKNPLPGSWSLIKLSNQRLRAEQWFMTRSAMSE